MVVGTQKAGTTWLFECLSEHPEVFVPELKEVHYFCPPDRCRVSRARQGEAWYRGLYDNASAAKAKARGDMTTDYMYLPGVPEAFRPRLFQEYSRAPGSRARGTGLGLFVVRALAEAQGGSVTYAPRVPRGSVFTLTLPAVRQV